MSDREPTTGTTVVETGVDEGLPGQFNPVSNSSSNPGSQASSEKHLLLLSMVKSLQSAVQSTWHMSQLEPGEIQSQAVLPRDTNQKKYFKYTLYTGHYLGRQRPQDLLA